MKDAHAYKFHMFHVPLTTAMTAYMVLSI